jgi:hypothetical protein
MTPDPLIPVCYAQGKADQQRAKLYGKIGKQIAQAARKGGASPQENSRLKELMDFARAAQVYPCPPNLTMLTLRLYYVIRTSGRFKSHSGQSGMFLLRLVSNWIHTF